MEAYLSSTQLLPTPLKQLLSVSYKYVIFQVTVLAGPIAVCLLLGR